MDHMTSLLPNTRINMLDHWTAKASGMLSAWGALPLRLVIEIAVGAIVYRPWRRLVAR